MKWYMLGGLRVASQRTTTLGWETAALGESPVRVAYASSGQPVLVVLVQQNVQTAATIIGIVLAVGLFAAPWQKRRGLGLAVRHGHVIGMTILFTFGTLPWPLAFQPAPASAACEGCECPTPVPPPPGVFRHYHFDHLGSTAVVSDEAGDIVEQIRYYPYGEIRGRWDASGIPISSVDPSHRHEFTGYETELYSGLQYAGARFYDPEMGSFLTHDPVDTRRTLRCPQVQPCTQPLPPYSRFC